MSHSLIRSRLARLDEIAAELQPLELRLTVAPKTGLEAGGITAGYYPGHADKVSASYAAEQAAAVARAGTLITEIDTIHGELESAASALRSALG